jgi:RHS repeat-associated protein
MKNLRIGPIFSIIFLAVLILNFFRPDFSYGDTLPSIGYTTQQMAVNGTQNLTASGGSGNPYTWSIIRGGGSLSSSTGNSVTYTAPSSNSNCANNPTIQVTDSNGYSNILSLAVNAYSGVAGYNVVTDDGCAFRSAGICSWQIWKQPLYCNGNLGPNWSMCSPGHNSPCTVPDFFAMKGPGCDAERAACYMSYCPDGCAAGIHDLRGSLSGYGCCPAELISPCQMHITNFQTNVSSINVSAGQVAAINGTIVGNPGGSTNWTVTIQGTGVVINGSTESVEAYWNGLDSLGKALTPGNYTLTLTAQTTGGACNGNSIQRTTTLNVTANPIQCLLFPGGSLVNVASGNLNHTQALFQLPNAKFGGDFSLSYNSLDGRVTPLGQGWTHSYNIQLLTNNDGSYTLIEGDGQRIVLYSNAGKYTPQKSNYPALTKYANNTYTLENKNGLIYSFDTNRIITGITDRNSNSLAFSYTSNNLTGVTDPSGRTITLQYDPSNRISLISDPMGNGHSFTYTGQTLTGVSSQIVGLGTQYWVYTYDGNGNMLTRTDPGSFTTTYTYDGGYRLYQSTDPQTKNRTIAYNPSQSTTQITEKDGGVWTYFYDAVKGALTAKTDPLGNTTHYTYDTQWNLVTVTDPRNYATSYTYDANGNVTSITNPLGNITTYAYNALNKITAIGYPGNATAGFTYDTTGNLTSATDPMGNLTQYGYDSRGNLTSATNALNQTTTLNYNTNNYLTSITDPNNASTSFTYSTGGNLLTQTDPLNNTTSFQYNGLGKMTSITDHLSQITGFAYDLNGNLTSKTDGNNNQTQYQYNYMGRVTSITDALNQITQITYGSGCPTCGGRVDVVTSITDANNHITSFQYNQAGKLIQENSPLGYFKTYTYDAAGNRVTMTDENQNITQYAYDQVNRLTQVTYPDSTTKNLGYDTRGNITSTANVNIGYTLTFDLNNRLTGVLDSNGRSISYQYDVLNRRSQMTSPDGRVINYTYDLGSRLSQIVSSQGAYGFSYDSAGRRTGLTYPNGVTTAYTYNSVNYLTNLLAQKPPITVDSFVYTHDAVGNRLSMTDLAGLHTYQYDPLYQILQAVHPLPPTEQFSYDPVGNRSGTTVDSNNALLEDSDYLYAYDYNDNLVQKTKKSNNEITTYSYDYENRLKRVQYPNMDAQYKYDPLGRRIEKNVNGTITRYFYDGDNTVTAYDGTGNVKSKYLFNLSIDDPLSIEQDGNVYYYHKDGLSSITELTNSAGNVVKTYRYDSFGNIYSQSGTLDQPFTFTGREYDSESGLYYYRARYYDSKAGRFIGKDPIGFGGGDVNWFRYVQNNPLNSNDPFGLYSFDDFLRDAGNFSAGFGDTLTSGFGLTYLFNIPSLTEVIRNGLGGNNTVNPCSIFYRSGEISGYAWGVLFNTAGYATGYEFTVGRNLRFAPWGNRTGNPYGELPHYHRRIAGPDGSTIPGGGIRWHRPWERGW